MRVAEHCGKEKEKEIGEKSGTSRII